MFMIIIIIIIIIILIITFSFTTNVSTGAGFLPLPHRSHRFGGTMKDADREAASAPDNTMTSRHRWTTKFQVKRSNGWWLFAPIKQFGTPLTFQLLHTWSFWTNLVKSWKTPVTCWTQKWRFGRWFSLSIGWFLGFMLIFQGFILTWWHFARCNLLGKLP